MEKSINKSKKVSEFWNVPKNNAVQNMLRLVVEIENIGLPPGVESGMTRPYHRGVYKYAALLFDLIGESKDSVKVLDNPGKPQEHFMAIVNLALCWYIVRFGQSMAPESVACAVLRRIDRAYQALNASENQSLDQAFDKLIEKAGGNLVCFDSIGRIGVHFGINNFEGLYHRFMCYHCREEISLTDRREKFLTPKETDIL